MSDHLTHDPAADVGLLSTVRAGSAAEAATGDSAWLRAMLDAEVALTRAQAKLGLVPADAADLIERTATVGRFDLVALARAARAAANPVVAVVAELTAAVAARDPGAADFVHRGSTSQDILDTAAMLVASRTAAVILADLDRTTGALAALAAAHRDTPMAGRTLTQHAVPVTFGLKAAGWLHAVAGARRRLATVHEDLPVQLGGAAGTLAGYVEHAGDPDPGGYADRLVAGYAAELGLREPVLPWHTARAPVVDLAAALTLVTGALGKFAADVRNLSRTEIGEVAEPAADGRGASSAMPHKRNPVLATLIVSAARQVPAHLAVLAGCLVAEDERPAGAWHAEWQPFRDCLRLTGGAAATAAELAEGLTVDPERMLINLRMTGDLIVSERIAVALTPALGKAPARRVVTEAAATAARTGRRLVDVLAGRADPAVLAELADPERYLGISGHLVDRALRHHAENRMEPFAAASPPSR